MLMPKRVKYRRQHRGRMKGIATKGNNKTFVHSNKKEKWRELANSVG